MKPLKLLTTYLGLRCAAIVNGIKVVGRVVGVDAARWLIGLVSERDGRAYWLDPATADCEDLAGKSPDKDDQKSPA